MTKDAPARKSSKERNEGAAAMQVEEQKKGQVQSVMQGAPDWALARWNKLGEIGSKVDGAACKGLEGKVWKRVACFQDGSLKMKGEALELKEQIQELVDETRKSEEESE